MWTFLLACHQPPVDPGATGPYAAGVTTLHLVDDRGKQLTVEVWYPAIEGTGAPGVYEPMTLQLDALRDAEPEPGPWPMVGFSHGSTAIRFQSAFLTEHLATHGFVVAAPDHTHNTLFDPDDRLLGQVLLERPDDVGNAVQAVFDAADESGVLSGMTEPGEWAVLGHSFGALTALMVGGAVPDLEAGQAYCDREGGRACDVLTPEFIESARDQLPEPDPAVVSTIAMSPLAWYAFGAEGEGLAAVSQPLVLGGDRDPVTAYDTEIVPVYKGLSSPKRLVTFTDAGHYPFSDICLLVPLLFEECDPAEGYADLQRVQDETKRLVTAHLFETLGGDWRYRRHFGAIENAERAELAITKE